MEEKIVRSERLGEQYTELKLDNGLTVLVYPMPQKQNVYALLGAKIGSVTGDFLLGGRRVTVPPGIAHFLEHKLFESEQGDAFNLFAETGASANAYTSYDKTCYLFSSSVNVEASLRILIDFVFSPHFTAETVAKEQGIIGQEIRMYDDSPDWVLAVMTLKNLYSLLAVREDIAGTVETIARITPELLYDCYNAFYRPQNMTLAVAGNITPETVKRICAEACRAPARTEPVEKLLPPEPSGIVRAYDERRMSVASTQFCLGYKETPHEASVRGRRELGVRMIDELLGGETSPLYRRLYDAGLVNDTFDVSALDMEECLCITFSGESEDPQAVADAIRAEIARVKAEGFDPELFEECRRAYIGSVLCGLDSTESVCTKMLYCSFKNAGIYDIIRESENITREELEAQLRGMFDERRSTLAVIKPLEEEEI